MRPERESRACPARGFLNHGRGGRSGAAARSLQQETSPLPAKFFPGGARGSVSEEDVVEADLRGGGRGCVTGPSGLSRSHSEGSTQIPSQQEPGFSLQKKQALAARTHPRGGLQGGQHGGLQGALVSAWPVCSRGEPGFSLAKETSPGNPELVSYIYFQHLSKINDNLPVGRGNGFHGKGLGQRAAFRVPEPVAASLGAVKDRPVVIGCVIRREN